MRGSQADGEGQGRVLRIATRGSALALRQTEWVADRLRAAWSGARVELVSASTAGDRDKQTPLTSLGQGVFVKGVEELLLVGAADIAVHSLKDVPTLLTASLELAAFPPREDPRDGLVCRVGRDLRSLPPRARVGTGSPRRAAQLLQLRQDLRILPVRGNLDTRLRKLRNGEFEALVLAVAGLARLGRQDELDQIFEIEECTPAVGQGALVIQTRTDDHATRELVAPLDDRHCRAESLAERAFLAALGGGCQLPAGALARVADRHLQIVGVAAAPDGRELVRAHHSGNASDAATVGHRLAELLLPRAQGLLSLAARA
ncbi:MAG: hydroxymethylbilane synthase [Chloroflexi bacterium]|nr:hydroxymethylbilane synthase [Chloroflexota bacterium]